MRNEYLEIENQEGEVAVLHFGDEVEVLEMAEPSVMGEEGEASLEGEELGSFLDSSQYSLQDSSEDPFVEAVMRPGRISCRGEIRGFPKASWTIEGYGRRGDLNLQAFINDRQENLYGEANLDNTSHYIRWSSGPVCKLTDGEDVLLNQDGQGKRPTVYGTLLSGFQAMGSILYYQNGTAFGYDQASGENAPIKRKLLKDLTQKQGITSSVVREVTVTTAETQISEAKKDADGDTYIFQTQRDQDQERALLTKGLAGSLLTFQTGKKVTFEDIVLDGSKEAISGNTHGGMIRAESGHLILRGGTTMRNVNSGLSSSCYGGAVYSSEALVSIENGPGETVEFLNCEAGNGGAIFSYKKEISISNEGSLTLENCSSRYGEAVHVNDTGGSITLVNQGTIHMKNCSASECGGALSAYRGPLTITNKAGEILFEACSAANGGGIYCGGSHTLEGDGTSIGTTLFDSSEKTCSSGAWGGSIYSEVSGNVRIEDCSFLGASGTGGGIYLNGSNASVEIEIKHGPFIM